MRNRVLSAAFLVALCIGSYAQAGPGGAPAADTPRHDICADIPERFGMGLSSYSDYGPAFIQDTHDNEGVNWDYVYTYVGPAGDRTDEDFITYVLVPKFTQARQIGRGRRRDVRTVAPFRAAGSPGRAPTTGDPL